MSTWAVHISDNRSGRSARHGRRLLGVGRSALVVVLWSLLGGCASIGGPSHESARKAFEEGNVKEAANQYKQLADEANSSAASWMYGVIRYHGSGDIEAAPEEALPYLKRGESYYAEELRSEYYSARKQAVYDTILDWQSEGYTGTSSYRVNNAYKLLEYYHPSPGSDDALSASRLKVLRFWASRAEAEHLVDKPMTTGGTREVWVDLDLPQSIGAALDKISPRETLERQSDPRPDPELASQFRDIVASRKTHDYLNSPNTTCHEPYVTAFWTWQAAQRGGVKAQYRMWQLYDFDALDSISQHDAEEFSNPDNLINCWTDEDNNGELAHKWLVLAANNGHEEAMSRATSLADRGELGESPVVPALDLPTRKACYVPEGENKFTALQEAARTNNVELARCMLERNAELDAKDRLREETHLHRAARHGSLGVVKLLVDRGARANARDKLGRTPLHGAAYKGHVEIVDYLAEHARGIGLNAIDEKDHRTAIHFAALEGRREVAESLLAAGADPTIQSDAGTARAVALAENNDSVAELLAEHGVKDIRCRVSADAAFDAVATGSLTAVRCQFSHGVDFDTRNDEGGTALHVAARNGSVAVARWLADEAPGLVSARDGDERTPIEVALNSESFQTAEVLVDADEAELSLSDARLSDLSDPLPRDRQVEVTKTSSTHNYMQKLADTLKDQASIENECDIDPAQEANARLLAYFEALEARYEYRWSENETVRTSCGFGDLACGLAGGFEYKQVTREGRRPLREVYLPGHSRASPDCGEYRSLREESRRQFELLLRNTQG